jgi:hypothetical protein
LTPDLWQKCFKKEVLRNEQQGKIEDEIYLTLKLRDGKENFLRDLVFFQGLQFKESLVGRGEWEYEVKKSVE